MTWADDYCYEYLWFWAEAMNNRYVWQQMNPLQKPNQALDLKQVSLCRTWKSSTNGRTTINPWQTESEVYLSLWRFPQHENLTAYRSIVSYLGVFHHSYRGPSQLVGVSIPSLTPIRLTPTALPSNNCTWMLSGLYAGRLRTEGKATIYGFVWK